MPQVRRALWLALVVLSAAAAFLLFQRYVLDAATPTLSFVREGVTYELLSPRMLFVVFVLPFLIFIVGKSLADLPHAAANHRGRAALRVRAALGHRALAGFAHGHDAEGVHGLRGRRQRVDERVLRAAGRLDRLPL